MVWGIFQGEYERFGADACSLLRTFLHLSKCICWFEKESQTLPCKIESSVLVLTSPLLYPSNVDTCAANFKPIRQRMWAKKSVKYYLISEIAKTGWGHFVCLCTLIWANYGAPQSDCFHLGIKATFQIYSPFSLCCHRRTANQSTLTLHRFIVCRCNELWSLWFTNRLSVLNLIGMKTIIKNCFMRHGTCYKSKAKLYFISFYWVVNISNRVFPVISTVMNSLFFLGHV